MAAQDARNMVEASARGAGPQTPEASRQLPMPAPQAILEVIDGVHKGVSMPLDKSAFSVGSTPNVDIALGDTGVAAQHGVIRLQGRFVIVEATGGEIGIGKRHRIPRGHGCRTTLPIELTLGTAAIRIAQTRAKSRWVGRSLGWSAIAAGCGLALVLSGSFGLDADFVRRFVADASDAHASTALAAVAPIAGPNIKAQAAVKDGAPEAQHGAISAQRIVPDTVIENLSAQLKNAGLTDVSARLDGKRVIVSGAIEETQRNAWSGVQRWFDRLYGNGFVLASAVETRRPDADPKFDLQAVSVGATPYVITGDGQRRHVGAVLDKGWVIKEIRGGSLKLAKDTREFELRF